MRQDQPFPSTASLSSYVHASHQRVGDVKITRADDRQLSGLAGPLALQGQADGTKAISTMKRGLTQTLEL